MASVQGLQELKTRIAALKFETKVQLGEAVEKSAIELRDAIKAAAPVASALDPHPGALKASVHIVDGQTPLMKQVVADAVDEKGQEYGGHVEHGHRTEAGTHVGAQPFFFPAYRLVRKRVRGRIVRAVNAAAKTAASNG